MRSNSSILISLVAASTIPAIIFTLISMLFDDSFTGWVVVIFPFVLLLTFAHTVLLGLPFFLLLRRFKVLNWWSMTIVGFAVGVLPALIFGLIRQVDLIKDGTLKFIQEMGGLGLLGALGALSFWYAWNYLALRSGDKNDKGLASH